MDKKQILADNKLIAQLMTTEPEVLKLDLKKAGTLESMHYHNEWDWIMPVVEKIEMMLPEDVHVGIEFRTCIIPVVGVDSRLDDGFDIQFTEKDKITAIFKACVEFASWYLKG